MKPLILVVLFLLISACSKTYNNAASIDDLQQQIKTIMERAPGGKVEPIPMHLNYVPFKFVEHNGKLGPFNPSRIK